MADKQIKQPGPDHPITIEQNPARIVVSVSGRVIADTKQALTLREANYPPVQYIPLEDVDTSLLQATNHTTYCPYKGDCNYYSIPAGAEKSVNAVWTYRAPYPAVADIKDHCRGCLACAQADGADGLNEPDTAYEPAFGAR